MIAGENETAALITRTPELFDEAIP